MVIELHKICRNYMSIIITIVSNITVLVSHNVIFFGFFMPMDHGVNKKTPSSVSPTFISSTRFLLGLFIVLEEILHQSFLAVIRLFPEDNAFLNKIRFFLLAHCWLVLILLFRLYVFFTARFFYCSPIMILRIIVIFPDREKAKFEVYTTSIILSVNK